MQPNTDAFVDVDVISFNDASSIFFSEKNQAISDHYQEVE